MNHPECSFVNLIKSIIRFKAARLSSLVSLVGLVGCNTQLPQEVLDNGYPTQARVEYVLQCMEKNGGQNYDSMYPCVCSIDKIATQLAYEDYSEALTFTYMRSAPGEAGGLFRDPPRAKKLRKKLKEAEELARKNCFVKTSKPKAG